MFDFDNDGRLDIWAGGSDDPNQYGWLFAQGADGRFAEVSRPAGIRHACPLGVAWADFDHDGDVDMVVGTSTARTCGAAWMGRSAVRVYENIAGEANWTTIRLGGRGEGGANRAAIGARVRVTVRILHLRDRSNAHRSAQARPGRADAHLGSPSVGG